MLVNTIYLSNEELYMVVTELLEMGILAEQGSFYSIN
jgi:hypothetical protein